MKVARMIIEYRNETAKIENDFEAVTKEAERKYNQICGEAYRITIPAKKKLREEYDKECNQAEQKFGAGTEEAERACDKAWDIYKQKEKQIEENIAKKRLSAKRKLDQILEIIKSKCSERTDKLFRQHAKACDAMGRTGLYI